MMRCWVALLAWVLLACLMLAGAGAAPVTAYADPQFGGASRGFSLGGHVYWLEDNFAPAGNDNISALEVKPGYAARVCEHEGFGWCHTFSAGRYPNLAGKWDNAISYVEVRRIGERFLDAREVRSRLMMQLFRASSTARRTQRFGGMQITLTGCFRAAPSSVRVTCNFDFHQQSGRTGFELAIDRSRLELFERQFPATALEVGDRGPRAQVPFIFSPQTHTSVRFHFAVPPRVHALQRLRYNVGDTIFVFDNIAVR